MNIEFWPGNQQKKLLAWDSPVASFFEHTVEPLDSIKERNFLTS